MRNLRPWLVLNFFLVGAFPISAVAQSNVGTVKVGGSANTAVTITIASAGTLGSISVRTMGAENLDFTTGGGGTCAMGTEYAVKSFCTVNVGFKPRFTGARYGAVVLLDGNGNVMGSQYVQGNGQGPQATILTKTATALPALVSTSERNQLISPDLLQVDGNGNLFVSDVYASAIVEETPSEGTYVATLA